jgi:hypothetical protein
VGKRGAVGVKYLASKCPWHADHKPHLRGDPGVAGKWHI